jgi:hypothetical protein
MQVQHCVGRAYFEVADYPKAKHALETMQQVLETNTHIHIEQHTHIPYHITRATPYPITI